MWVVVHATDAVRPMNASVTCPPSPAVRGPVAAEEGMVAPPTASPVHWSR